MFQIGVLNLANQGFGFSQKFCSIKSGIFSGGSFPNIDFSKIGSGLWFKKFRFKFAQVAKIGFKVFSQSSGRQKVLFGKVRFCGLRFVWSSQVCKIGFSFPAKVLASLVRAFLPGLFFLAKSLFRKVSFQQRFWQVLGFGVLVSQSQFPKQIQACKKLWCV